MSHTFIVEPGRWIIKGSWRDKNKPVITFKGATIITWDQANWFTMKTKLVFDDGRPGIEFDYKGFLPSNRDQYTYVLRRTDFDKIEGEGWINTDSIIQRYWILGDNRHRTGFESLFQIDESSYFYSSTMVAGNNLISNMEGIFERH
ncbi:MAG: hypothetical protein IGQ45_14840 [Cyanobacterium sp. T60_A2020_053]|nr:hypothetical protein [Cyanobacterium sp. T60_A2020_053]